MKIEIKSTQIEKRSGEKNGRPWEIRTQEGWIELDGEIRRVNLDIPRDTGPYSPGVYFVNAEKSSKVDGYGRITYKSNLVLEAKPQEKANFPFPKAS